jgi:hypothetical protein
MIKYLARQVLKARKNDAKSLKILADKIENKEIIIKHQPYERIRTIDSGSLKDLTITKGGRKVKSKQKPKSILPGKRPGFDSFEIARTDNRPSGSPSTSSEVWEAINRSNNPAIPKGVKEITQEEIRNSDLESIRKFRTNDNSVGYLTTSMFCNATKRTASSFGFIAERSDRFIERSITKQIELCTRSTSSGWPIFRKKNTDIAIQDTTRWLNNFSKYPIMSKILTNPLIFNPNFIGHRYQAKYNQETGYIDTKIRQIWMQPMRILCLEIKYFNKFIKQTIDIMLNSNCPIYASGLRNIEISNQVNRFRRMLVQSKIEHKNKALYSLDYSKFDATVHTMFVDMYFFHIRNSIKFKEREFKEFDLLRFYFKHSPFMYDKKIYFTRKGVNSGSFLTNNFDTFVNCSLMNAVQFIMCNSSLTNWITKGKDIEEGLRKYSNINDISNFNCPDRKDIITLGDDGLVLMTYLEIKVLKKVCEYIGMSVDIKNVCNTVDEPIFFLGRYWDKDGQPYQSEQYIISHCVYRERYYNKNELDIDISEELEPIRIISICAPLSNGVQFMYKYFKGYTKLWNFINSNKVFPLLKDVFPFEGKEYKFISEIYDWRNF